jgi:hypothetical protein
VTLAKGAGSPSGARACSSLEECTSREHIVTNRVRLAVSGAVGHPPAEAMVTAKGIDAAAG